LVALLDKYAKANNFTVVLDFSGQSSPVVWADTSIDITKPVLDAYNTQSGIAAPAKPAASTKPTAPVTAPKEGRQLI
jgi:outer membrane protein